jgi:hypothetical protein
LTSRRGRVKSRDDGGIELEVEGLADIESRIGGQRQINLGLTEECECRLIGLAMMSQVDITVLKTFN